MNRISLLIALLFTLPSFCSEEAVSLELDGVTLKGTLASSGDASKSQTLVILIAGSGPTDRDGNNAQMKNNALKYFSDMLVENGHACLRYDKRAIGESAITDFNQREISFDQFISDASAWVDKYATDVRFHQIILAGHSQGSLVALCAANQNENVDGVISLAGAGERIHEILKWQLAKSLSIELQGLVNAKLDTLAMGDTLQGNAPEGLNSILHPVIQPFLISWMKYDPAEEAKNLKQPLLIINGSNDLQVTVDQAKKLKAAQPNATYAIIQNMNHVLKFTKEVDMGPQLEVYSDPDLPLHKKLAKVVLHWLEAQN